MVAIYSWGKTEMNMTQKKGNHGLMTPSIVSGEGWELAGQPGGNFALLRCSLTAKIVKIAELTSGLILN